MVEISTAHSTRGGSDHEECNSESDPHKRGERVTRDVLVGGYLSMLPRHFPLPEQDKSCRL